MTDEDAPEDAAEGETPEADGEEDAAAEKDLSVEGFESRLDAAAESLEAAETEADLDEVEATLDDVEADLDEADLPEPDEDEDEEDAENPREEIETRLSDLRDDLEEQRGPYASDVVDAIEGAQSTLTETRWTETGKGETVEAVNAFFETVGETLDAEFPAAGEDTGPEALSAQLDPVVDVVEDADLDADEDAETIAALLEATDALETGLAEAEEWDDLVTHEQLAAQGYYDVLGHYKDYPVEWAALKEHEQRGNVDMVLLALDSLQSDFMERHCLEAITRMGDPAAFDAMHQRAQKRDKPAITALGKMGDGAAEAVETLVDYVDTDSDPGLQKVTFKALGEIGAEEAVQPLANKLVMDNDNVRPYAARALGLIGDARAVEPLADTLENDESDNVRAAAAWALRQIGTEAALEAAAEYDGEQAFIVQTEAQKARDALDERAAEA